MDKYKLVERAKVEDSGRAASEDEVRVTSVGKTRNFVMYATSLLQDKGHSQVTVRAMGRAIGKAVLVAEQIKSTIPSLHQLISLLSEPVVEHWKPLEEGLLPVTNTRHMSCIIITLSKAPLDSTAPGYQAPQPLMVPSTEAPSVPAAEQQQQQEESTGGTRPSRSRSHGRRRSRGRGDSRRRRGAAAAVTAGDGTGGGGEGAGAPGNADSVTDAGAPKVSISPTSQEPAASAGAAAAATAGGGSAGSGGTSVPLTGDAAASASAAAVAASAAAVALQESDSESSEQQGLQQGKKPGPSSSAPAAGAAGLPGSGGGRRGGRGGGRGRGRYGIGGRGASGYEWRGVGDNGKALPQEQGSTNLQANPDGTAPQVANENGVPHERSKGGGRGGRRGRRGSRGRGGRGDSALTNNEGQPHPDGSGPGTDGASNSASA